MTTSIADTPALDKTFVLTSEVSSIYAHTDAEALDVSLSCLGVTFFSTSLYAYNGVVELFDAGSLIEYHFLTNGLICESVTIKFGSVSKTVIFQHCENLMPASYDPQKSLLLSSLTHRAHRDSLFTFAALPIAPHSQFLFKVVGHDESGRIASTYFYSSVNIVDTLHASFSVASVINKATGRRVPEFNLPLQAPSLADVMYFSVEHDERQLMCFISPAEPYLTFRFLNIFNIPEFIDIEGSMVTKSETSQQEAVCSGLISKYDRSTFRSYQFTSAPLHPDEEESLAQFLSSSSVQIRVSGTLYDIVIDDYTFESSSDDDSLNSVKFSWRFKNNRPVIFNSSIFGISPSARKIFSTQYSPEYE